MTHRIPFNYDLYLTGKYRAVYRDREEEITAIKKYPLAVPGQFYQYEVFEDSATQPSWGIGSNGNLYHTREDENDVFLEPIPQPFNLEQALKGSQLITRSGIAVTQFKRNPDHASPKPYIAMAGGDLIYYSASGCVNYSCEPHPLDLFMKIN